MFGDGTAEQSKCLAMEFPDLAYYNESAGWTPNAAVVVPYGAAWLNGIVVVQTTSTSTTTTATLQAQVDWQYGVDGQHGFNNTGQLDDCRVGDAHSGVGYVDHYCCATSATKGVCSRLSMASHNPVSACREGSEQIGHGTPWHSHRTQIVCDRDSPPPGLPRKKTYQWFLLVDPAKNVTALEEPADGSVNVL